MLELGPGLIFLVIKLGVQCKMNYKDAVKKSMEMLAEDPLTKFIGYNLSYGSKAYGTLADIDKSKIRETPVAENLMTDLCIGMALRGYKPVLIFERHDFILNALDALINHLDKFEELSDGVFVPKVLIRAIVGSMKPINPGPQHMQDFSNFFKEVFHFPVYDPQTPLEVIANYETARSIKKSAMFIERRDMYDLK